MKISRSQSLLPSFPRAILYFHPIISKFSFMLLKMSDVPPHAPKTITFLKKKNKKKTIKTNKQLPHFGTCFSGKSICPSVCTVDTWRVQWRINSTFGAVPRENGGQFIRLEEKWGVELVCVYLMGYFEEVIMRYDRRVIFFFFFGGVNNHLSDVSRANGGMFRFACGFISLFTSKTMHQLQNHG